MDRVIGFEGVGYNPDMVTAKDLESRLLKAGVLTRAKELNGASSNIGQRQQNGHKNDEGEDDDDWD